MCLRLFIRHYQPEGVLVYDPVESISAHGKHPQMPSISVNGPWKILVGSLQYRFPSAPRDYVAVVSVSKQQLFLYRHGNLDRVYSVSTSRYGVGNEDGSLKTPLGVHRVLEKIGAGVPSGTVFKHRKNTKQIACIYKSPVKSPHDLITTRILQLEGLEPGINRGKGINTRERNVYIHGTHEEGLIGQPASIGCVRMRNTDVIELFEKMKQYSLVVIVT